jgi:hypothetical protein
MKKKRMTPKRALKLARRRITRCILCGSDDLARIGLFIPYRPGQWPGPAVAKDKTRSFWYGVCEPCSRLGLSAVADKVEQLLAAPLN